MILFNDIIEVFNLTNGDLSEYTAALERINTLLFMYGMWHLLIDVRRIKYLNNMVEQDHRGIKNITKYTLGFK